MESPAKKEPATPTITLSVVMPVYNEADCIETVIRELVGVLDTLDDTPWEILAVNDGSTDETPKILQKLQTEIPGLRVITLTPNAGQSAAFGEGFRRARGEWIVTIDADGQNDPADIPTLLSTLREKNVEACIGYRANRKDTFSKRYGSKLANWVRNRVLHESVIDTGCSLKIFQRRLVERVWMFRGMHRFLPSIFLMQGARIEQRAVHHRPRTTGHTKYTNWGRLKQTIGDLRAVRWMKSRHVRYDARES